MFNLSDINWLCTACLALYLDPMENKEETKIILALKAFIVSVNRINMHEAIINNIGQCLNCVV